MFKKSRRKIVAAIMSILVLLWVSTLGVIYASSYIEMSKQNHQMLKAHAEMYTLNERFDGIMPPNRPFPGGYGFESGFEQSPMFKLSVFYTVAISTQGEVLEIKNQSPTVYTDEELEKLAFSIIKEDRTDGTENNLAFYKTEKEGYTLVTFKDNTVLNQGAMTLFRYTLIFGGVALVLFFFVSVFLSRKIVNPLEESYQKQKQFISDAGHELKTPVSVVSANAELLSLQLGEDNKWLKNIQYENERMGILVGQLLTLARTETVTPQKESVDFSRLVVGEALPFESVAFEKGRKLITTIQPGIYVQGDGAQLKQLVAILLDNAIRHGEECSQVSLSLIKEHGTAKLTVINKGDEIDEEHCQKIFERFYRVDTARNSEDNHYGLGLAIAKAIATSHKGHIQVQCYDGLVEFNVQIPIQ